MTARDRHVLERRPIGAPRPTQSRSFEALAIRVGRTACNEARRLAGRRFLVAEAPRLPLGSWCGRCTCSYETYPDRRDAEPRRGIDLGISGAYFIGAERRRGCERRIAARGTSGDSYYDYMRESGDR